MRCLQPPVSACISHVWRAIYSPGTVLQQPVVAFPDKPDWGAVGEERRGGAAQKVRAEGGGEGAQRRRSSAPWGSSTRWTTAGAPEAPCGEEWWASQGKEPPTEEQGT